MRSRVVTVLSLVVLGAGCGGATPAATTTPGPGPVTAPPASGEDAPPPDAPPPDGTVTRGGNPTPPPTGPPPPSATGCTGPAPGPGFVCVRNCGGPVASESDPPPGYSWLSAADARRRELYGCPRCLPGDARIATPTGERAVSSLRAGDALWTLDRAGARVAAHVVYAGATLVSASHELVRVTLADGRAVTASPGHPTAAGTALGELREGDPLSDSEVTRIEPTPMQGDRTFDVLPSGDTGAYWADGVLLRSTFAR